MLYRRICKQDFLNDVSGAAPANIAGRKELKGRKMGALEKLSKEQSERKQGLQANPMISGAAFSASSFLGLFSFSSISVYTKSGTFNKLV